MEFEHKKENLSFQEEKDKATKEKNDNIYKGEFYLKT